MPEPTAWETIRIQGSQVVDELKRLLHEGNVRRVVVKQKGRSVAEFPVTVGVVGALLAPVVAAIGALVAVLADCSVEIERTVSRPSAGRRSGSAPGVRRTTRKPAGRSRTARG